MSAPPPPPPPGPPPMPAFNAGGGGSDPMARNMLLESIRQGKALKKTTVNDRSAPLVDGNRNKVGSSGGGTGGSNGGAPRANGLNAPPGLGGLFAGGMPKLKPVGGSPGRRTNTGSSNEANSINTSNNKLSHGSIGATNTSLGSDTTLSPSAAPTSLHTSPAKPPPPQPPPSNLKPSLAPTTKSANEERRINFGKPSVAPKPPINGPKPTTKPDPPPKLFIPPPPPQTGPNSTTDSASSTPQSGYASSSMTTPSTPPPSVNRAQSMRMPKSGSPTSSPTASMELGTRTMGRAAGRGFANAAGQPPPPPRVMNGGTRMRPAPLRPPSSRPPPPPNKAPPAHPPPPPPVAAPPPPPHRTAPAPVPPQLRVNGLGPLPPAPQNGPPPPPTRSSSSMRSVASAVSVVSSSSGYSTSSCTGIDLEARFGHLFHRLEILPNPAPFSGKAKSYPSKNAQTQSSKRQPAPQPPTHNSSLTQVQLGPRSWANDSVC